MLIAMSRTETKVRKLPKERIGFQDSMLSIEQGIISMINKIILLPVDLTTFVASKNNPNAPGRCKCFKINKKKHVTLDFMVNTT